MNKQIIHLVIAVVLAGGVGFYFGSKNSVPSSSALRGPQDIRSLSGDERQARFGGFMASLGNNPRAMRSNGETFLGGEVISKNTAGITLKILEGGSRLIFFSASTSVVKNEGGSTEDISIGDQILVSGNSNNDGSMTALSVQLRRK